MNPRKMKQMMKQMGIDVDELDAERVVIETGDGDLVFETPQVTRMDAQGQQTYQIVGEAEEVENAGIERGGSDDGGSTDAGGTAAGAIPEEDVSIVAERAGVPEAKAREALEATDGDLAAAIANLE
ncbi:nascent polypeptide-associated complex protein [Halorubrum luteum]